MKQLPWQVLATPPLSAAEHGSVALAPWRTFEHNLVRCRLLVLCADAVGNKLLMLFFPFLRKWTYTRMHEQVGGAVL